MNVRRVLAGVWAILPLAALLVTIVLLPPVDPGLLTGLMTTVVMSALAAAAVAVLQGVIPQSWSRWALALIAGIAWGAWLLHLVAAWRAGLAGPAGVGQEWILVVLVGGVLAAGVGYAVHSRRVMSPDQLHDLVPERSRVQAVRGRGVSEVRPWATDVDSRTMQVLAWGVLIVFAAALVLVLVREQGWVAPLVLAVVGLGTWALALAWSKVTVSADEGGLQVRSRVLPVRVARVPAADVFGVEVQVLDPMRWGGIGLRPGPDRTSFIVDSGGPGLVVYRRDGRRLALQVTEGDSVARDGARVLLQAAGQRLGAGSGSGSGSGSA